MGIHWVLNERKRNDPEVALICHSLEELGSPVHFVDLVPFASAIPVVHGIDGSALVICHGPGFVPRALTHPTWKPGIFFDAEAFSWSACRQAWANLMLNVDAEILSLHDIRIRLADGQRLFVRPDRDDKSFDGAVYDAASFARAIDEASARLGMTATGSTAVVARPIEILTEFRTFVVDGEIVAASSYKHEGRPHIERHVPNAVIDIVLDAASKWMPSAVAAVDVAIGIDGGVGIVEANCFNAARLYGARPTELLAAVCEHTARMYSTR